MYFLFRTSILCIYLHVKIFPNFTFDNDDMKSSKRQVKIFIV